RASFRPRISKERRWSLRRGRLRWPARGFPNPRGAAFPATQETARAGGVCAEARARASLCNSVDDPDNCDFYYPSVVNRGDLQIAISTGGHSPALAQRLRLELEQQVGAEYDA